LELPSDFSSSLSSWQCYVSNQNKTSQVVVFGKENKALAVRKENKRRVPKHPMQMASS